MPETEMKTLTCPGPPGHEFQIPKGRGRPPRYCDEHKPNGKSDGGQKVSEETSTRPRPRPGAKQESNGGEPASRPRPRAPRIEPQEKGPLDEPTPDPGLQTDPGLKNIPRPRPDTKARAKSEQAANRANSASENEAVPLGANGRPMARIDFSTSELIPTGNYANVTVGPIRMTAYVDLDREVDDDGYFTRAEMDTLVRAANELAEMAMRDVIGVQRNLVLESLQADQGDG